MTNLYTVLNEVEETDSGVLQIKKAPEKKQAKKEKKETKPQTQKPVEKKQTKPQTQKQKKVEKQPPVENNAIEEEGFQQLKKRSYKSSRNDQVAQNERGAVRGRRGRGRGRGRGANNRGREFDRHVSGTGIQRRGAKRRGAGRYNWGVPGEGEEIERARGRKPREMTDEEWAETQEEIETPPEKQEEQKEEEQTEEKKEEQTEEKKEEPTEKTFDEYLKEQREKKKQLAKSGIIKKPEARKTVEDKKEEYKEIEQPTTYLKVELDKQKKKKEKKKEEKKKNEATSLAEFFKQNNIEPEPQTQSTRGRGGRGRGRQFRKPRQAVPKLDDQESFPAL